MLFAIRHETRYEYEDPASYSIRALKLTPRADPGQRVLSWRIQAPGERIEQVDPFDNLTQIVTVDSPHRELRIIVEGVAEVTDQNALPPESGRLSPLVYLAPTTLTRSDAALRALAERHLGRHPPSPRSLMDLVAGIRDAVDFEPGTGDEVLGAAEALDLGAGAYQDQAHVLIACCRSAGIPARYVNGYIQGGGATGELSSHAWTDVWLGPDRGWLSLDVAHAGKADTRHCRLAVGRDYFDAAPVRGARRGGGRETMAVSLQIAPSQVRQQ
jgi:transglutaminase-like putative cysteine protease